MIVHHLLGMPPWEWRNRSLAYSVSQTKQGYVAVRSVRCLCGRASLDTSPLIKPWEVSPPAKVQCCRSKYRRPEGSVRLKHSSPPGSMMCRSKLTLSGAIQTTGMHPILRSRQIGEDVNGREGADERVVAPMLPLHLMHVIVPVR